MIATWSLAQYAAFTIVAISMACIGAIVLVEVASHFWDYLDEIIRS